MTNPLKLAANLRRSSRTTVTIEGNVNTGGGAEKISDLEDVNLTGLADDYILVYDAPTETWIVEAKPTGGTGDITAITTRATSTVSSTSSIAAGAQTQFNATLDGKAVRLYTIETNVEMRVRIYTDSTSATADSGRPIGTDPATNSGCLFEFITTPSLLISKLSPLVDIFSSNTNQEEFTFILTNLSASSSILEVDFTYITQEL